MIKITWTGKIGDDNYTEWALQIAEPKILYHARINKFPSMDADDIAQELRLHLFEKLKHYDPQKGTLLTWTDRVLRNRIISIWRVKNKQSRDAMDASPESLYDA